VSFAWLFGSCLVFLSTINFAFMKEVVLMRNHSSTPFVLQWATGKLLSGPVAGVKFVSTKCKFFVSEEEAVKYAGRYLKDRRIVRE